MIDQSGASSKYIVFQKGPIASFLGGSPFFDAYSYNAAGSADIARTWFTHSAEGTFSISHINTGTPAMALSIDTSANVGIGTTAPDRLLHIYKATAGSVTASSDAQLVVENSAIAAINLLSGSSSHGQILFGDAADNDDGQFGYDQANREFYWKTAGSGNKALKVYANDNVTVEYGKVGIGTTNPGYALDIRQAGADIFLSSTTGTNRTGFQSANTGGVSYFYRESSSGGGAFGGTSPYATAVGGTGAYPLQLGTNNAVRLTIASDGNVGIGTDSPDYKFDLTETDASVNLRAIIQHTGSNQAGIDFKNSAHHVRLITDGTYPFRIYDQGGGADRFWISSAGVASFGGIVKLGNNSYLSDATTSSVSLNSSGDVLLTAVQSGAVFSVKTWNGSTQAERFKISGAGATATTAITGNATVSGTFGIEDATISYSSGQNRLEVDKDLKLERSTGTSIYMRRTTADTVSLLGKIEFGNNNIDSNVAIISAYQGGATDAGELRFETEATGGSIATRMTIKSDGKVGIGTTAPTKLLHVRAPANSTGGVIALLQSHDTANGWLQIQGNAGNSWEIGATDSGFQFYDDETAAYRVTIKNNGDVGIGVASLKTWYGGITQLALGSNRGTVVANASYIGVTENAYLNASAAWKKVAAGGASNVWQDDGTIYFRTTATGGSADDAITWNTCAMDSSGEFGIGTSSPAQKLHVVGDAVKFERTNNAVALQLYNTNASPADGTPLGYLQFMGKDNDGTANIVHSEVRGGVQSNSNTAVNGYLAFLTTNNGTSVTEHMRIKADGTLNLISAKLLINGGGGTAGYHLQTDGSGNISWQAGGSGTVTGTGTNNYIASWNGTTALEVANIYKHAYGTIINSNFLSSYATNRYVFEVAGNPGTGAFDGGIINLRVASDTNSERVGQLAFINSANANHVNPNAAAGSRIAQIISTLVTTDSNAGDDSGGDLQFWTKPEAGLPAERMRILSDGKVGIGTTNPGSFQTWINAPAYFDDVVWTANAGGLGSYDTGGTLKSILILNSSDELVVNHNAGGTIPTRVKGDYITFEPSDSVLNAPIETMRIVGGIGVGAKGCVGIGTNAPVATLEVAAVGLASGQAASKGIVKINGNSVGGAIHYDTYATLTSYNVENRFQLIAQDVGSDAGFFTLTSTPATGTGANKHWIMGHRGPDMSNEFQIGYKTSTASGNISATTLAQARLRIETSGRVIVSDAGGVANGVFGEYTKLVVDTIEAHAQLLATDTGSWGASFIMTNAPASGNNRHWWFHHCPATHGTTANSLIIRYAATNTAANIGGDGTGTTPVEFKTDGTVLFNAGSVGIGTTAPGSYKLRVQGDVYISGTLTEASSLGIKENIETYSPSLEKINKMRPVRFNKKKSKKKEVGLVAEELAEMFPELVETDEKGNAVGVNYSRAVAVLLHGFKELYKEVKELKEKI